MKLDDATADRLRELGASDDMLRWLREPEAVRELLAQQPADRNGECPNGCYGDAYTAHGRECVVVAAWRALGDPRGAEDIERAWDEAIEQDRCQIHDDGNLAQCAKRSGHKGRCDFAGLPDGRSRVMYEVVRQAADAVGFAPRTSLELARRIAESTPAVRMTWK